MAELDSTKHRRTPWRAMLLVVLVTAVAIWLVPGEKTTVVELPPASTEPTAPADQTAAPARTASAEIPASAPAAGRPAAPTGSTARELIAAQRSAGKPDPQAAYDRARELAAAGQPTEAYLLDFYAARLGHGPAAFTLAEQADPAYWRAGGALKAASPEQALKWYRAAAAAGHPDADQRLDALRQWAAKAADKGDPEAQRLMLAWQ